MSMTLHRAGAAFAALLLVCHAAVVFAQERATWLRPKPLPPEITPQVSLAECGPWTGHYGPIDYRSADETVRNRVETVHFNTYLPQYLRWIPSRPFDHYIAANFSYTLRVFPNHPAVMMLMEQTGRRLGSDEIPGSYYPLECWYMRALQTVPDDPLVRAQYGIYLAFRKRPAEARRELALGDKGMCLSGVMQNEIGLAYFQLGEFRLAQLNAMRSDRLGYDSSSLKSKLQAARQWDGGIALPEKGTLGCETAESEPDAPAASESSAAASAPVKEGK